jgi:hypothetical protein
MGRSGELFAFAVVAALAAAGCDGAGPTADASLACTAAAPGCTHCGDDPSKDDYGDCGGQEIFKCDRSTGEWVHAFCCDAYGILVETDLSLDLALAGSTGTCPATPPTSRLLHVAEHQRPEVTADPPVVVVSSYVSSEPKTASIHVETTDDWGTTGAPVPVAATYDLDLQWTGGPTGTFTGTVDATYGDSDPCVVNLDVTGTWDVSFGP